MDGEVACVPGLEAREVIIAAKDAGLFEGYFEYIALAGQKDAIGFITYDSALG